MKIRWSVRPEASLFWAIDQLSRWDAGQTVRTFLPDFLRSARLGTADRRALELYACIRREHAAAEPEEETMPEHPLGADLLPSEPLGFRAFPHAFFARRSFEQAAAACRLPPRRRADLLRALERLRPVVAAAIAEAPNLRDVARALSAEAQSTGLPAFLDRVHAAVHGCSAPPPRTTLVELLFAPGPMNATQLGARLLVPIYSAPEPAGLLRSLATVAHEFGHATVSQLPYETRRALCTQIVAEGGVLSAFHPNLIDEAIHTAMANIVFLRASAGANFDGRIHYGYEPESDYPYAIDALARALEPAAARALEEASGYASMVAQALQEQRALFGDPPRQHARVALVYSDDPIAARYFQWTFPALRRWIFDARSRQMFIEQSGRATKIARWILTLDASRGSDSPRGRCSIKRRNGGSGWDFLLVARDLDTLRQLLIAVHLDSAPCADRTIDVV